MRFVIFAFLCSIYEISGHFGYDELSKETHVNRDELIAFLRSLNEDEDNLNALTYNHIDNTDYSIDPSDKEKERKLKEILWLLKRNFDALKRHEVSKDPSGTRLYFIKNPEVLDKYRNYINNKNTLTQEDSSNLSSQEDNARNIKDMLLALRRNWRSPIKATQNPPRIVEDDVSQNFVRESFIDTKADRDDLDKIGMKNWNKEEKYEKNWEEKEATERYNNNVWTKKKFTDKYESSDREQRWNQKWSRDNQDKSYEAKRYKYNDYGGRGHGVGRQRDRAYLQGRTAIPIIGKRGIYENE